MRITILTLFPRCFDGFLDESIIRIARGKGAVEFDVRDLRRWGLGARRTVDDRPYGGGAGMVLLPEVLVRAVEETTREGGDWKVIFLSASGSLFDHAAARRLAACDDLLLVCGRYEGFDRRAVELTGGEELSIGDYVTSGGEAPAMVVVDAVVRLLPGVLGNELSTEEESYAEALLEYPHYTRPEEFRGLKVPEVLLGGNHGEVAAWRRARARERTRRLRPDLYARHLLGLRSHDAEVERNGRERRTK